MYYRSGIILEGHFCKSKLRDEVSHTKKSCADIIVLTAVYTSTYDDGRGQFWVWIILFVLFLDWGTFRDEVSLLGASECK